jgi:tRNA pseudouridine55 synthase
MSEELSGVLIVHKHAGVTSHDIVGKVRRLFGTRKVGHAGTLDPMATGVLVVLIGRAAKAAEYLASNAKRYRATLRLGITTDTEDTTGEVLTTSDAIPDLAALQAVIPSFCGKIQQIPPMYSALKVGGKKLVDLARQGQVIERQAREIEIFDLQVAPTDTGSDFILDVSCSGGTYIRTLCADIGAALGCGGAMAALERREACGFSLENAHTVDELEQLSYEERTALLIPTELLFASLPQIPLPSFYERLCRSGCEIYLKKLRIDLPVGTRVRLLTEAHEFFALGEVFDYENGAAVKAIKTFSLE